MAVNYEYYVLSSNGLHGSDLSDKLNSLGKNGWEYVQGFQSTYGAGTNEIILKKRFGYDESNDLTYNNSYKPVHKEPEPEPKYEAVFRYPTEEEKQIHEICRKISNDLHWYFPEGYYDKFGYYLRDLYDGDYVSVDKKNATEVKFYSHICWRDNFAYKSGKKYRIDDMKMALRIAKANNWKIDDYSIGTETGNKNMYKAFEEKIEKEEDLESEFIKKLWERKKIEWLNSPPSKDFHNPSFVILEDDKVYFIK